MISVKFAVYDSKNGTWVEKYIWQAMDPDTAWSSMSLPSQLTLAYSRKMLPESYKNSAETYCRNSDRTANNELENITNVNYKSKVAFVWKYLKPSYLTNLLTFLKFKDDYHESASGQIKPEEAPIIKVTYRDFLRERTINAYLGQSIEADLVEYDGEQYWESVRLAFPER